MAHCGIMQSFSYTIPASAHGTLTNPTVTIKNKQFQANILVENLLDKHTLHSQAGVSSRLSVGIRQAGPHMLETSVPRVGVLPPTSQCTPLSSPFLFP